MVVLITGSNRSGTTWVGECLRRGLDNPCYRYEPMNMKMFDDSYRGDFPVRHHFHYITEEEKVSFIKYYDNLLRYNPYSLRKLARKSQLKGIIKYCRLEYNSFKSTDTIIKDPLALFSAEFLYQRYSAKVVVLLRNPFGYVHSIMRKGWRSNPANLLLQDELLSDLMETQIVGELKNFVPSKDNIFEEAVLRWKVYHSVIIRYMNSHRSNWHFVKHEDLVDKPLENFEDICAYLDIDFKDKMRDFIQLSTTTNKAIDTNLTHNLVRNSKREVSRWMAELSDDQIKYIKIEAEPYLSALYPNLN